ncbi:hypothetical protein [Spirochaeta cellobiosiphila]|uniref:hypothetical protein n=1 Tax=Spirochaeta cellobiosiphila TaxID=504483 RepID=UPI000491E52F|nr:hypothetical protein [Spirochaeta cellobiosiphila]
MEKIYRLRCNKDHLVDIDYDIFHMPFEEEQVVGAYFFLGKKFSVPEKLLFSGDFNSVGTLDYISNDLRLPVFSKKMIDFLISLGSFEYEIIPCEIFDFSLPHEDVFEDRSKWTFKPGIEVNRDYYAFRLLDNYLEMDYDKSEYELLGDEDDSILTLTNLVLKQNEASIAPIFRIKEMRRALLVTNSVKEELESAGFKGLIFTSKIL